MTHEEVLLFLCVHLLCSLVQYQRLYQFTTHPNLSVQFQQSYCLSFTFRQLLFHSYHTQIFASFNPNYITVCCAVLKDIL